MEPSPLPNLVPQGEEISFPPMPQKATLPMGMILVGKAG